MSANDMNIDWVNPDTLKPDPKNANEHDEEHVDDLIKQIRFQGWRLPIIVSKQTGLIRVGHGRRLAAMKMGERFVPVSYQDFSDDQDRAFAIAENASGKGSKLNLAKVNEIVVDFSPDFDLDLLGLKDFRLDPPPMIEKEPAEHCPTCNRKMKKKDATNDH